MKKVRKPENFIYKPYYEGGVTALKKFVSKELKYPKEAQKNKIKGTVKLKYDIDYLGKVVSVKVIKSLGYGCDEEAIRIVTLLKYKVRKPRKGKVTYHKSINIHFKLPKSKEMPSQIPTSYQYSFQEKSTEKHSINYKIIINKN